MYTLLPPALVFFFARLKAKAVYYSTWILFFFYSALRQKRNSRKLIQADNDGKSGIYMWINNINGKTYVGQASDLGNLSADVLHDISDLVM